MSHLLEFIEIVQSYRESAVVLFLVAVLTWVLGQLFAVGSGAEGVPWYVSVIIFLSFFPVISFRIWLTQKRQHGEEIQNFKDSRQQTEDTLHQQIATLKDQLDTRSRHREQRETLACFIEEGTQLRHKYIAPADISHDLATQWLQKVSTYLEHTFGHSYVTQWKSDEGFPAFYLLDTNVSKQNEKSYLYLSNRLLRLNEIMKDLRN